MKRRITYSPASHLVYFDNGANERPIAFIKGGEPILFANFKNSKDVTILCSRAYIHEKPQTFNDEDDARETEIETIALYNLSTKRTCYFVKKNDLKFKISKVTNTGRNCCPNTLQDEYELNAVSPWELAALEALINSSGYIEHPKYGTYLPTKFAQFLLKNKPTKVDIPAPNATTPKFNPNSGVKCTDVKYVIVCDGVFNKKAKLTLQKTINGNVIEEIEFAAVECYTINPTAAFRCMKSQILAIMTKLRQNGSTELDLETGETFWRAYEASKIVTDLKRPPKPKEPIVGYWLVIDDSSAGKEICVEKFTDARFVDAIYVGTIENDKTYIYPEYEAVADIITSNMIICSGAGMRGPLSISDAETIWAAGEEYEKNQQKNQEPAKPSTPVADIDSEAEREQESSLITIGGLAPITKAKTISSPLNINSKIILV